ncbi:hypothetical protein TIFTF001_047884 [Ficus carica]|uniref:Uncharacterized protein n=1 Tax=Ficus carica TaxID=3494 RepID=A0AA87Z9R5_FICCA|nr:hypothetical protein TIFTF001_047884 [Ficus carica]
MQMTPQMALPQISVLNIMSYSNQDSKIGGQAWRCWRRRILGSRHRRKESLHQHSQFRNKNFTLKPSAKNTTAGGWVAMDARSGRILWSTADPSNATASGPVSVANGVLFA